MLKVEIRSAIDGRVFATVTVGQYVRLSSRALENTLVRFVRSDS